MPHQQRWYPASSGAYSKVEEPKPEAASQKSTISWSIWTLLIASLVINLVLTRSHLIMRQSSSHAHPLSLFTGDKSPDHDNVTPLNCNKKIAPAAPGAPACVSDPSELPRKGWSTATLQGKQGNVLQSVLSQVQSVGIPLSPYQMLLFDQVSFARHMASVSQTTSGMAGKPEMLEQLQHLRGVHYKPGSKGIVMVGGGAKVLGNALVTLRVLRSPLVNCTLPVELIYQEDDPRDPPDDKIRALLSAPELAPLTLISGKEMPELNKYHAQGHGKKGSYAFKAYALAFLTSFQHALFLDTDSIPLKDPSSLFSSPEYQRHGNLFWPDFWHDDSYPGAKPSSAVYSAFDMPVPWLYDPEHRTAESGQILLDRARHWDVLQWLWFLNSHVNPLQAHLLGDKDTFLLAFYLAGKGTEYEQVRWYPREALATMDPKFTDHGYKYHHSGMVQHFLDGSPGFLHKTAASKFFPDCSNNWVGGNHMFCKITHITSPLHPRNALLLLDAGRTGFFWPQDVDAAAYKNFNCSQPPRFNSSNQGTTVAPPSWAAASKKVGHVWAAYTASYLAKVESMIKSAPASQQQVQQVQQQAAPADPAKQQQITVTVQQQPQQQGAKFQKLSSQEQHVAAAQKKVQQQLLQRVQQQLAARAEGVPRRLLGQNNSTTGLAQGQSASAAYDKVPDLGCWLAQRTFSNPSHDKMAAWEVSKFTEVAEVIGYAHQVYEGLLKVSPFKEMATAQPRSPPPPPPPPPNQSPPLPAVVTLKELPAMARQRAGDNRA